jgi:hypothetical protein
MRHLCFLWAFLCASGALAQTNWIRVVDISVAPGPDGQDEYSIKITPDKTQRYDELVFECVYHQEFPWVNAKGQKYQKIHEPVSFAYRRPNVDLVNELDAYIEFRVPMKPDTLKLKYGEKVFNPDHPITVSRLRISGIILTKPLWVIELPPKGKHIVVEVLAEQAAAREKERRKKEDTSELGKLKLDDLKSRK